MEQVETLTLLFADISGSTRIIKEHGDVAARLIIQRGLHRVAKAVTDHQGRVVSQIGDELMCTFPEARAAVLAAFDIQDEVRRGGLIGEYPPDVRLHIGLHHGPVILEEGQLFGDTIHVAKRLVDLAKADQILSTSDTLSLAGAIPGAGWRLVDRIRMKGYDHPVAIHEAVRLDPDMTLATRRAEIPLAGEFYARCRLAHGAVTFVLEAARPVFTIGRDPASDLVIQQGSVSRDHGRLEYQKGRIIYLDHSTNGTFISEEGGLEPVLVHHEQRWLRHQGLLRFGARDDPLGRLTLGYRCERAE
ncbi:adenylate/guanylate cyclase domain-containing protein [Thiocystis violacea]|uniref:adenylate/guanylate cyclase domain-containing protein n=1 Tax=Thiocystis violacea TaxID=13725 RepID=UPI0019063130|nr:adenylate/guanylate cyclase domain-containing protein [Thiocystis violacea]MBK1719321.1 hypothetical protein [Thiocystis violacea]